jgi:hypothetical protein
MKRIEENERDIVETLKPVFGTKANPPFYDPNDLHVHLWKKGKLGIEDNPKISTYSKNKVSIKNCVYCTICHLIKDNFQSTVCNNKDLVKDILLVESGKVESYQFIKPIEKDFSFSISKVKEDYIYKPDHTSEKLFHQRKGIFDDYVKVEEDLD